MGPVEVSKHAGIIELPTAFSERVLLILDFPASSSLSTESSAFFFFGRCSFRRTNANTTLKPSHRSCATPGMNGCGRLSTFLTADGSNKQSGFHCRAATIAARQLMRLIHRFVFADATSCHQSESRHVLSCSPSLSLCYFCLDTGRREPACPRKGSISFLLARGLKSGKKKSTAFIIGSNSLPQSGQSCHRWTSSLKF